MRTRSGPVVGQSWSMRACCPASAASTASRAPPNAASIPSPVVFTTVPLACSTAARSSASCAARATAIASGCSSQSRVLPAMSVMRNVAVRDSVGGRMS